MRGNNQLQKLIHNTKIPLTGVLHVGAHEAQELKQYTDMGVPIEKMIWIEANIIVVDRMTKKNPSLKYIHAAISDVDDEDVTLNITTNEYSSSLLPLGTHKDMYPDCKYISHQEMKSSKLSTVLSAHSIKPGDFNMLNIDIQGVELKALKGMDEVFFEHIIYIEIEINNEDVYLGCSKVHEIDSFLNDRGFTRYFTMWNKYIKGVPRWGDAIYLKTKALNSK